MGGLLSLLRFWAAPGISRSLYARQMMLGERFISGLIEACEDEADHLSWRLHVMVIDFMLKEPGNIGFGDIRKQLMLDTGPLHV